MSSQQQKNEKRKSVDLVRTRTRCAACCLLLHGMGRSLARSSFGCWFFGEGGGRDFVLLLLLRASTQNLQRTATARRRRRLPADSDFLTFKSIRSFVVCWGHS